MDVTGVFQLAILDTGVDTLTANRLGNQLVGLAQSVKIQPVPTGWQRAVLWRYRSPDRAC